VGWEISLENSNRRESGGNAEGKPDLHTLARICNPWQKNKDTSCKLAPAKNAELSFRISLLYCRFNQHY